MSSEVSLLIFSLLSFLLSPFGNLLPCFLHIFQLHILSFTFSSCLPGERGGATNSK